MSVKKKRRITVAPVDEPPTPLLMSRLRFGEEASTRYMRGQSARVWTITRCKLAPKDPTRERDCSLSLSDVLKRVYATIYYPLGTFDHIAWGDVLFFMYPGEHICPWVVVGDHLHREEWRLSICRRTMPLQLYDAPEAYYNTLDDGVMSMAQLLDTSRLYGHRMKTFLDNHFAVTMPPFEPHEILASSSVVRITGPILTNEFTMAVKNSPNRFIRYIGRAEANRWGYAEFVKLYNRRMDRVKADMKVILWVSLRYIHVEEQCFPWDVCLEIISFLAAPRKELLTEIESV